MIDRILQLQKEKENDETNSNTEDNLSDKEALNAELKHLEKEHKILQLKSQIATLEAANKNLKKKKKTERASQYIRDRRHRRVTQTFRESALKRRLHRRFRWRRRPAKTSKSLTSSRTKTASAVARVNVDWPQLHVFRDEDRQPVKFDDLTIAEFVFGYLCSAIDQAIDPPTRDAMLSHLKELMLDCSEFSWITTRSCHAAILQQIETSRLTWRDQAQFLTLRQQYAQRATCNPHSAVQNCAMISRI